MNDIILVVRANFDGYVTGDVISDTSIIADVLAGPHQHDVIKCKGNPAPLPPIIPPPPAIDAKS
jgi:hypothetical protein